MLTRHYEKSLPGNACNDQDRCICAGYDNGDIKLFDLRNMSVCCVEFDRKDINMNKLVATSLEGKLHVFDMRTQHPTKGFASVSEKGETWTGRLTHARGCRKGAAVL
ncbi:UNVERIFIED_CONTAM: hypothetical protein FKN15_021433 [Acipenser sinensis]